jgi:hypothetical protein
MVDTVHRHTVWGTDKDLALRLIGMATPHLTHQLMGTAR